MTNKNTNKIFLWISSVARPASSPLPLIAADGTSHARSRKSTELCHSILDDCSAPLETLPLDDHSLFPAGALEICVGRIVHGQYDAGGDLQPQHHRQDTGKRVCEIQVPRHRIDDEGVMHQPRQRQASNQRSMPVLGL